MSPDTKALFERAKAVLERQQELITKARQLSEQAQAALAKNKLCASLQPRPLPLVLPMPPLSPAIVEEGNAMEGDHTAAA